MAGKSKAQLEAEQEAAAAQERLVQAQNEAIVAQQGLAAVVTQNIPPITVELLPGTTLSHNGETFYGEGYPFAPEGHSGNDSVQLDGPTAIAHLQAGHVKIKGA